MHLTIKRLRRSSEIFASATLADQAKFEKIIAALKAKKFSVTFARFELSGTVCLTVKGLRSDKAVQFAADIILRAGRQEGFVFHNSEYR